MHLMTAGSSIQDLLSETSGAAVFGIDGEDLGFLNLGVPASPTLLVAPITDALKTLSDDGFVTGSLDRGDMWRIVGYHLDEETSHRLASKDIEISQIHEAVLDMGLVWQARPFDDLDQSASSPI